MNRLVAALCLVLAHAPASVASDAVRYRMLLPDATSNATMTAGHAGFWEKWLDERGYDVAGLLRRNGVVDIILRRDEALQPLLGAGFQIVDMEHSAPLAEKAVTRGVPPGYVDPDALAVFLSSVAADHPDITDLTVIGQSYEGRDIYALEISDHPGMAEDEPAVLLNGLHHAREVVTPHVVMDAIDYLTDGHAAGDPQIVDWVERYKIVCVPMVNPDGSEYVHTVDDFHRKNTRPVCTEGDFGVDLNRNYPYHWGSGVQNCNAGPGSSGDPCQFNYRGSAPASEPETQAMINLAQQRRFLTAVSYHSFGQFIDYPYACNDGVPDLSMPEHQMIDEMMHGMANAIFDVDGVAFDVNSPIAASPVNGDDTSWYYAYQGTYAMIVEVGTSFQPDFSDALLSVNRNRAGWLYLLQRMDGARLDVRVANQLTGEPFVAEVELLDFVFDTDELPRFSDATFGRSRWLVPADSTYTVRVQAAGYRARTLSVAVADTPRDLLVLLTPNGVKLCDSEPDGDVDLADFRQFQDCLGETPISQPCRVHDTNADESVTSADYPFFERLLDGPQ